MPREETARKFVQAYRKETVRKERRINKKLRGDSK
jgi:hypothetical protein